MPRQLNVRVICATNRNLKDLVRQGKFRLQADWERSNNPGKKYVSIHRIGPLKDVMREVEIELIKLAYEKLYTIKRVLSALGVDQSTITRRLRKLGIRRPL